MDQQEMKEAIKAAIREELGQLFVEREQHFVDHEFIKGFRKDIEAVRGTACKATILGTLSVMGGFILWSIRHYLKEVLSK